MFLKKLFKKRAVFDDEVQQLYIQIVNQSRTVAFYRDWEVADTVEGRFDMIVLHIFVVFRKLKTQKAETEKFSQQLYDLMFADMDLNLRELGVGDMGLARRVPKMAEALYGRMKVYEEGLGAEDENELLKSALDRNLYRKTEVTDASLDQMVLYLREMVALLEDQTIEDIMKARIRFPDVSNAKNV